MVESGVRGTHRAKKLEGAQQSIFEKIVIWDRWYPESDNCRNSHLSWKEMVHIWCARISRHWQCLFEWLQHHRRNDWLFNIATARRNAMPGWNWILLTLSVSFPSTFHKLREQFALLEMERGPPSTVHARRVSSELPCVNFEPLRISWWRRDRIPPMKTIPKFSSERAGQSSGPMLR
jgi:hypothetical protein